MILILLKETQNFVWVDIIMVIIVVCLLMENESLNKNVNFPIQFCLGSTYDGFGVLEPREVSLNGNVYDFPADYNSVDKSNILNIHKYFMTKNNIR